MSKLVISTVGTSLLTNQIEPGFDPDSWERQLIETVNASEKDIQKYHPEVQSIINDLQARTEACLKKQDIAKIRATSAELNGIYGLYQDDLSQGSQDAHFLIATDTAQGQITSSLLANFLKQQGIGNTSVLSADGLSIASSRTFSQGIAKLLPQLQETIQGYQDSQYQVCFNLVGGFKALQGFFNVVGMFYADQIIYVFEGSNELITIPKLPVTIDPAQVEPHKVPLAMMNAEEIRASWEEAKKVPSEWVDVVDQEMILSTWGQLVWDQCKTSLLTNELLKFPGIFYEESFKEDYRRSVITKARKLELHEKLAKVATQLMKFNGDTSRFERNLHYTRYEGGKVNHIDHFYVNNNDGWRVSCIAKNGNLYLRHYGEHDYVNNNP
jgi:putative CRISPR-associated protein (TIGR02619 family)